MIQELRGKYRPLSNFWSCFIQYEGVIYPSVENAYQAAKMANFEDRKMFENCKASEAKQLGRTYPMVDYWEKDCPCLIFKDVPVIQIRVRTMFRLVWQKFQQDKYLRSLLIGTGDEEIQEGNWWGDTFWGTVNGKGENWLGRILMKVREELKQQE